MLDEPPCRWKCFPRRILRSLAGNVRPTTERSFALSEILIESVRIDFLRDLLRLRGDSRHDRRSTINVYPTGPNTITIVRPSNLGGCST